MAVCYLFYPEDKNGKLGPLFNNVCLVESMSWRYSSQLENGEKLAGNILLKLIIVP